MGKNYKDYQQAQQNLGLARLQASDAEGGSTKDTYLQAHADLSMSVKAENAAWEQFQNDPEG